MKAYHFELKDGERGTLAACPDDWTEADAREVLEFRYSGRVVEIREAGSVLGAPFEYKRMLDERAAAIKRGENQAPRPYALEQHRQRNNAVPVRNRKWTRTTNS